ncbi:hypothetical protein AQ505_12260 [Pedobacter sp. PACM 27299]|uniref:DUF2931 family protein n=1 Tax=Pedobacter sp. PACM 27299 TaxID=1727164 RepID=UPI0007068FFA|nr:DUF2931 family protein [Pedobacter sp. PACM 27299]ALL06195.1 hypothetical protein AQ505_12260 [Pedobacter sp. PACM 27299]
MSFKTILSAILVAIFALIGMFCTQNADLNLAYAAFCCSAYVILIALLYFHFNTIRRKLNLLHQPNIFFELAYGFVFYLAFLMFFPVLLFIATIGDEYEHRLYADLGNAIVEMFPLLLILSIFLTVFSSIIFVWAIKSYKRLVPVLIGYVILMPIIESVASTGRDLKKSKQAAEDIAYNLKNGVYEWHAAMSNPAAYPVQLYKGVFSFPKREPYEFTFNEGNTVNYEAKWGDDGNETSKQKTVLPNGLDLTWYSFAEDTFYRLNTPIDQEMLKLLFSKPYLEKRASRNFEEKYDAIIMGFAPGGVVVVWAGSTGRRQLEIGHYQARKVRITEPVSKEERLDYNDVFNPEWRIKVLTDSSIIPLKIQRLTKDKPIPYGYWDTLRTTYNWKPTFVISPEIKVHDADFSFYNAERYVFFDDSLLQNTIEKRGVPEEVYLKWYDENGNRCAVDFEFDEEKTFKQFDDFFNRQKNSSAAVEFNIDHKAKTATATLKNGKNQLLLLETKIIAYGKNY